MTSFKAPARPISNAHLLGLSIGNVCIPQMKAKVPWEGFGERALLLTLARRHPRLHVVPQPFRMKLTVAGRPVRYTPDYLLLVPALMPALAEVKSARTLAKEDVQERLHAAEEQAAQWGYRFNVYESGKLSHSIELRNVRLLRQYARRVIKLESDDALRAAIESVGQACLAEVAAAALKRGIQLEDLYSAIYRDVLTFDWEDELISEHTMLRVGGWA